MNLEETNPEEQVFAFAGPYNPTEWDDVFAKMELKANYELPIRIKNWIKNNYESPWPKR